MALGLRNAMQVAEQGLREAVADAADDADHQDQELLAVHVGEELAS